MGAWLKGFFGLVTATSLIGCAGDLHVIVPPHQPGSGSPLAAAPPTDVRVEVVRALGAAVGGSRQAAFDVPLGDVSFAPGAVESVRQVLESELAKAGHRIVDDSPRVTWVAQVERFEVGTNTTPLYWDVVFDVAVALDPTSSRYRAECVDRTYVNPGKSLIAKLAAECLAKLGDQFARDARVLATLKTANGE